MNTTETPRPISVRPTSAPSRLSAMPNSRLPPPATNAAEQQDAARPERIDQDAGRHLHHRIDVEVGRRQHPERGRGSLEGGGQILGDAGRREALEERQHVGRHDHRQA